MKTAMLLAAGRGERLKPLTDVCPKSLCLVGGEPLIVHHIRNLKQAGISHIVINHAWLGGKIRQYLGNGAGFSVTIEYSAEPPGGLETGGGLMQALPLLGNEPFISVNADIYSDFDFRKMPQLQENNLAHLVLVVNPANNPGGDFGLKQGLIENTPKTHTFSGIAVYRPELLRDLGIGRFSITPVLRKIVALKQVQGSIYSGQWVDIGSYQRLQTADQMASQ